MTKWKVTITTTSVTEIEAENEEEAYELAGEKGELIFEHVSAVDVEAIGLDKTLSKSASKSVQI